MNRTLPPAPLALALLALAPLSTGAQEKGAKHVLHLTDGKVLRVQARAVPAGEEEGPGRWEIRSDGAWVVLPVGAVTRATPERDLLRQSRALAREVGEEDPVRRAAYADWLVREGLHAEALAELDRLLTADPDQADARALLSRADLPIALPALHRAPSGDELTAFLRTAAVAGPVVQELAVQRLEGRDEVPGLVPVLQAELVQDDHRRRAFATLGLRRLMPGREVRPLLSRAILDPSAEVRRGASLALRDADEPALALPALKALGSANDRVRRNAAEALGTMNYAVAAEPLYRHLVNLQRGGGSGAPRSNIYVGRQVAYIQDFDVEVASNSAIADPVINVLTEGAVLDAAVRGVHEYAAQSERASVRRSLSQLTGARPGNTTAAWKRWWAANGNAWVRENAPATDRPTRPTTGTSREH
jgi:hypothetical protein